MLTKDYKYQTLKAMCNSINDCDRCCLDGRRVDGEPIHCNCSVDFYIPDNQIDDAYKIAFGNEDATESDNEGELLPVDDVEHPAHYNQGSIECIDAIKESMPDAEYKGFLKGQVMKYIWRYRNKGKPVEDLKKAKYYLEKLIGEFEKS